MKNKPGQRNGYEAQFGAIFQLAEAEGEELPEGVKEFYDGLLKVTERRDNVVNTLVEKAKKVFEKPSDCRYRVSWTGGLTRVT